MIRTATPARLPRANPIALFFLAFASAYPFPEPEDLPAVKKALAIG